MPVEEQVVSIYAAVNGFLDDVDLDKIAAFENEFHKYLRSSRPEILKGIAEKKEITKDNEEALKKAIQEFKTIFVA